MILFHLSITAQTEPSITYFDKDWNETQSEDEYMYYRTISKDNNLWYVYDYYLSGQQQMIGSYSDSALNIKDGLFIYFKENGDTSTFGTYYQNEKHGHWVNKYDEGEDWTNLRTSSGNYINGKRDGTWSFQWHRVYRGTKYYKNGDIVEETYWKNGTKMPESFNPIKEASYPGGFEVFYKKMYRHIKYPAKAKYAGIQGKVIAEFIITLEGKLTSIKILEGIGYGCDKEVIKALKKSRRWTPSEAFDVKLNQRFKIPFKFELE